MKTIQKKRKKENPKEKQGKLKAPLDLIAPEFEEQVAWVLKHGADKYNPWNWREGEPIKATTYIAAFRRHLGAWQKGEDIDPDSGFHPLAHVAAGCQVVLDAIIQDNFNDNRPKSKQTKKSKKKKI
jgi:hypothetical protein